MKPCTLTLATILFAELLLLFPSTDWAANPSTQIGAATQSVDPTIAVSIDSLNATTDPDSTAAAYAQAHSHAPNSIPLNRAFVAKMVALGSPALAELPARELTRRTPDDALAWAVCAYVDARRGFTTTALEETVTAARHSPDDAFVQRTAGQLLADYDQNRGRLALSDGLQQSLATLREKQSGNDEFQLMYRAASEAYARAPSNDSRTTNIAPFSSHYTYSPLYSPWPSFWYQPAVITGRFYDGAYRDGYRAGYGSYYVRDYYRGQYYGRYDRYRPGIGSDTFNDKFYRDFSRRLDRTRFDEINPNGIYTGGIDAGAYGRAAIDRPEFDRGTFDRGDRYRRSGVVQPQFDQSRGVGRR